MICYLKELENKSLKLNTEDREASTQNIGTPLIFKYSNKLIEFPFMSMVVLAPRLRTLDGVACPPIDMEWKSYVEYKNTLILTKNTLVFT